MKCDFELNVKSTFAEDGQSLDRSTGVGSELNLESTAYKAYQPGWHRVLWNLCPGAPLLTSKCPEEAGHCLEHQAKRVAVSGNPTVNP